VLSKNTGVIVFEIQIQPVGDAVWANGKDPQEITVSVPRGYGFAGGYG